MAEPTTTTKVRVTDLETIRVRAEEMISNNQEIITAQRLMFDDAPSSKQRMYVGKARKLFPLPYSRVGRGNRGSNRAMAV